MLKTLNRTAALLVFVCFLGQPANAAAFLVQIAVYVAGTAGLAGSVAKLSATVRDVHKNWIAVGDINKCRSHKSSLRNIAIQLRDIQETKMKFQGALNRLASGRTSPSAAWQSFTSDKDRILSQLTAMENQIRGQRDEFTDSPVLSEIYLEILNAFTEKRGLMEVFQSISWKDLMMEVSTTAIPPEVFQEKAAQFNSIVEELNKAISELVREVNNPCAS